MRKILAVILAALLLFVIVGCSTQTNNKPSSSTQLTTTVPTTVPTTAPPTPGDGALYQPEDIPEAFWKVLNNKQAIQFDDRNTFIDAYVFLECFDEIINCNDVQYTVITTDAGETMLLIEHEDSILVLFEDSGVVYGRSYNFRSMYHICANGVYTWNDTDAEGHHYGQNVLTFKDGRITSHKLWRIDNDGTENVRYMIGENEVTHDRLLAYTDTLEENKVTWSALTRFPIISDVPPGG